MFEGVGIYTILGTLGTVGLGVATPMDCYVGLAARTPSDSILVGDPAGTLGCLYDFGNTRIFGEHISSPSRSDDHPGVNHAGVKQLVPITDLVSVYAGASVALPSDQLDGTPVLGQLGGEFGSDNVKFYTEYILSIDKPSDGMVTGGLKFIF